MQTLGETKRWAADDASVVGLGCWVPDVPPHFVRRERLEDRLNDAVGSRLTVVTGMAGGGKSVLLAGWARGREAGTTAWLRLDPVDNEPVRFWPRLVRALQVVDPDVGDNVMAALSAGVSDSLLAEVLVGELAVVRPLVVVLDDLHRLTRPDLIHAIAYIAGHLPPHVHLIVTTRQPCGLGLHRLRMSGDLAEIDQDDLRFNDDEAGPLLSVVAGRPISSSDIEVLTARTEGWAAGLCLAGLILAEEKDVRGSVASFQGDSPLVAEYFQDEVLIDLPPETVRFMMETSVLDEITTGLCQEVTDRPDAGTILEDLADRNLLTPRIDAEVRWYRYHGLFADFLSRRLAARDPEGARQARVRAAAWLQRNGHHRAAFEQLVHGRAYDQALVVAAAGVARQVALGQPIDGDALLPGGLPESYLDGDPWRIYLVAAAFLGQLRTDDAAWWLRRLTRSLPDTEPAMLRGRVEMLWAIHDGLRLDPAGVLEHYERVNEQLGLGGHLDLNVTPTLAVDHAWVASLDAAVSDRLPLVVAWAHLWLGRSDRARATLASATRDKTPDDDLGRLAFRATLAHRDGQLQEASTLARRTLDGADRDHDTDALSALAARLTLAAVLRERNELVAAQQLLIEGLDACRQKGQDRWAAAFVCELIQVVMDQGRYLEGLARLRQLRHINADDSLPERLRRKLDQVEMKCRLALGDLEGALLILNTIPPRCTATRYWLASTCAPVARIERPGASPPRPTEPSRRASR